MLTALTRAPARSLAANCALTFIERVEIDWRQLVSQHAAYCAALRDLEVEIVTLPAIESLPDSVFIEDAAVVLDEAVILARPGVATRTAEAAALAPQLIGVRPVTLEIRAPGTLDGGDVLRIGRRLLVGHTGRTNDAGIAQLRAHCQRLGYTLSVVPVAGSLHLKTACTALDDATLLINPAWVDPGSLPGCECVHVAVDEPFAANVLRIDGTLLVNAAFPATLARVARHAEAHGNRWLAIDVSEFGKAEAGLTCLSIVYRN